MRYLAWFGVVFTTLLTIVYVAVFTPMGNSFIKPYVERKIEEKTQMQSKFSTFLFDMSSFEIVLEFDQNNSLKAKGDYSLLSRSCDLTYEVGFQKLEAFNKFTDMPLRGTFFTNGTIKGDLKFMKIDGMTDIGNSKSAYHATLNDLSFSSFTMKMRDAKLSSILDLFSKAPYATADIDLEVNLRSIVPHNMDGEVILKSKNAKLDPRYMKSDFNVTVPKTTFSLDLAAKLKGEEIEYKGDLLSNLFKITSLGKVTPKPFKADARYSLNVEDLNVLKPITGKDIRGRLRVDGEVNGTKEKLIVKGKSDIASSNSDFELLLSDFEPTGVKAKVENMEMEKLLHMLIYPEAVNGILNANIDYSIAQSKGTFEGRVVDTKFEKNQLFDTVKEFVKFDMYREFFSGDINATIDHENILASTNLHSINSAIKVQKAKFNTKTKLIDTDLTLQIKKEEYSAMLKGDIASPRVTIDFEKFMKTQAGKNVQEKINKSVDDLLKKLVK